MSATNLAMQDCIDECLRCHRVCLGTAMNHCLPLGGRHVEANHFRLMLTCAEMCRTNAKLMLIGTQLHHRTSALCAELCEDCARSCEEVGDMADCVAQCLRCAGTCRRMAA